MFQLRDRIPRESVSKQRGSLSLEFARRKFDAFSRDCRCLAEALVRQTETQLPFLRSSFAEETRNRISFGRFDSANRFRKLASLASVASLTIRQTPLLVEYILRLFEIRTTSRSLGLRFHLREPTTHRRLAAIRFPISLAIGIRRKALVVLTWLYSLFDRVTIILRNGLFVGTFVSRSRVSTALVRRKKLRIKFYRDAYVNV